MSRGLRSGSPRILKTTRRIQFSSRHFELPANAVSARLYICGLGLYHCELNGKKVGNEYLTPYCNAYDQWLQYQTYDITEQIAWGENQIRVMLGNGWYKGRYGGHGGAHSEILWGSICPDL